MCGSITSCRVYINYLDLDPRRRLGKFSVTMKTRRREIAGGPLANVSATSASSEDANEREMKCTSQ